MKHRFSNPGFSLVELALVLAIMATIGAIAMPRYGSSINRYRVEAAANRLRADLILVRETAKQRSTALTVTFVSGASSAYTLTGIRDANRSSVANSTVELFREPFKASFSTVTVGGDTALTFDGFGVPDSAGSIVIRVGSLTRTITVAANTGDIQITSP
jgi:prepilin-type N-terminal cleavage/methylation domain-containing protein